MSVPKRQPRSGEYKPEWIPCPNGNDCELIGHGRQDKPCRMFKCPECKGVYPACYGGAPDRKCDGCVTKESL